MSTCGKCREEFIQFYEGVQQVNADIAQLKAIEVSEPQKEGIILTMPKRKEVKKSEQLPQFPLRQTGTEE